LEEDKKTKTEITRPNYDKEAQKESTSGNRAAIILSYLASWVGGLIVFLLEKKNRFMCV